MRSYIGSIRPPARLARLGRCLILDFQKRKCLNFFISRPPRRGKQGEQGKGRKRAKARRYKSWWWKFRKVGPIKCLYSSAGRKEERNEVRGRRARKGGESIRVDAPNKQNEIRLWPKKKQRYGYHDRSPSIKKNLSKLLWVRRAFKHPKYAGVVNKIAFMIRQNHQIEKYLLENGLIEGDSFKKPKLLKFFFPKGSRYNDPRGHLLTRTLPAVRPSLNSLVMQYLLNTKKKIHFDPILVLKNFVEPGAVETSTMKRSDAPGRSLDKRIRSCIAFFVESSTGEKESLALAEGKKRLTHFIRQANDLRFAGRRKSTISLFPFFGATFFFLRDGRRVYNLFYKNARRELLRKLRRKCWNLMGKDKVLNKVMQLIDKSIDLGGIRELIRGMELMIKIILKNRRIPYGYNSYLNEVKKMRSLLSNRTKTNTLIESVKITSVYQSASLIAQDISFQLKKKRRSFRSIFSKIVKKIPLVMKKGIEGIRICCSGRLQGAEIARTECGKYGKTSSNVLHQKIDYASAEVSTRYGIVGVKVWISYSQKKAGSQNAK